MDNQGMRYLVLLLFLATGLINLVPVAGAVSDLQLSRLYGTGALHPDVSLLLRHRAILFGIVGALLVCAAFQPSIRGIATLAGLVSMVSFCVLVLLIQHGNPDLLRIAWIDVAASLALVLAYGLHWASARSELWRADD